MQIHQILQFEMMSVATIHGDRGTYTDRFLEGQAYQNQNIDEEKSIAGSIIEAVLDVEAGVRVDDSSELDLAER